MTDETRAELLPCPFCGGEASILRYGSRRYSCQIACDNCGCTHESSDEGEHSGTRWNTRASDTAERTRCAAIARAAGREDIAAEIEGGGRVSEPTVCAEHGEREWCECWQCDATGFYGHDCGEDCCCCLHPEDNQRCDICDGEGGWWRCYTCAPEESDA